jgi:hypothetical protein
MPVRSERRITVVGACPLASQIVAHAGVPGQLIGWDEVARKKLRPEDSVVLVPLGRQMGMAPLKPAQVRPVARALNQAGRSVVLVTSAALWGTREAGKLIADAEPSAPMGPDGVIRDLFALETIVRQELDGGPARLTVLRPAAMVGEGIETFVTQHFDAPRVLVVRGERMEWQFAHAQDVASAAVFALENKLQGTFGVASGGALRQADILKRLGKRPIVFAEAAAVGAAEALSRAGILKAPVGDLPYVLHPWVVAADGLAQAGWVSTHSSASALESLIESLGVPLLLDRTRLGARGALTATASAAGAGVAILGTAAVLRRARRRR